MVPLALAKGAGAEMRVPLGVAVFSGMLGVTFFGLFFTPVFYVVIRWFTERKAAGPVGRATTVAVAGEADLSSAIMKRDGQTTETEPKHPVP